MKLIQLLGFVLSFAAFAPISYPPAPATSAVLKGDGKGGQLAGVANTDYVTPTIAGYDSLSIHGADIASASTVNLNNATGNIVDVTGTVQINAITLAEGRERTVRFTGIGVINPGVSLILPNGGVGITRAAGDYAVFRGYAAGLVRCTVYQMASGFPLTLGGDGSSITGVNLSAQTGRAAQADAIWNNDDGEFALNYSGAAVHLGPHINSIVEDMSGSTIFAISPGGLSVGLWRTAPPSSQPATPTTIGEVISVLQLYGFCP